MVGGWGYVEKRPMKETARPLKTTITLPADAVEVLRQLAAARNVSFAEVVRRALHVEKFLEDARKEGRRVVLQGEDLPDRELVIF